MVLTTPQYTSAFMDAIEEIEEEEPPTECLYGLAFTQSNDLLEEEGPSKVRTEKPAAKRRNRYYQLGLMARVTSETSDAELLHLMKHDTRTFLLSQNFEYKLQYDDALKRTLEAIREHETNHPFRHCLAYEFHGDGCHFGRIHNNCTLFFRRGDILTLNDNPQYKNSCFKEVAYASNLNYYLPMLQLNDLIYIGDDVYGTVVKVLRHTVAICMLQCGIVRSNDYIVLPKRCYLTANNHEFSMFEDDLIIAQMIEANYFVIPRVRSRPYLEALRRYCNEQKHVQIIGKLDYDFLMSIASQLRSYLKLLDFVLIPDAFNNRRVCCRYILRWVMPFAQELGVGIIGKIPLENCCEFEKYEDHKFAKGLDCFFLEKSEMCHKYPLVVKHLLPVHKVPKDQTINTINMKFGMAQLTDVINYIGNLIETMNCRLIIINSSAREDLRYLTKKSIYCPVYVMLPLENKTDNETVQRNNENVQFAKSMALHRNLKCLVFDDGQNLQKLTAVQFGIDYARRHGVIKTCDMIVILNEQKEDGKDRIFNAGESSLHLQTMYVMPPADIKNPVPLNNLAALVGPNKVFTGTGTTAASKASTNKTQTPKSNATARTSLPKSANANATATATATANATKPKTVKTK